MERVRKILDYARYIQSQTGENLGLLYEDETEEDICADEERWDAQFAATQDGLKKMADKVRADIRAGRTKSMVFTKDSVCELHTLQRENEKRGRSLSHRPQGISLNSR